MKSFFSQNKKKIITTSLLIFFVAFLFFVPSTALAGDDNGVARVLGWIMFPFIWLMGKLAIVLLGILISVAQYSNFIHSSAVTYGWVVVRDLCNMFFVLILLIIAFASILRVESYNLKTWLPKLVIMAILINFSKLICGVFIDFAQVIMLTFVNAFKDIAGGNLTEMMGLTKILSFDQAGADDVTGWSIIGSMILALIFSVIAVVVILSMLVMLAMRIVLLWIYIVLSPLAYLAAAFPQGQATSQRWWSDFSKNVIVGPVLAFFIWLAFVSLGGIEGQKQMEDFNLDKKNTSIETGEGSTSGASGASQAALTEAGSSENMLKMIISVGMLLGGLMMAQEMGGRAGAMAGKGMAQLQTMGAGTLKFGKRVTGVERAQNAVKGYQQRKESDRSALAQKDAGRLLTAEGKAKQVAAYLPNKAGQGASYLVKRGFSLNDKSLQGRQDIINSKEDQLKSMKKGADSFDLKGGINSINNYEAGRTKALTENDNMRTNALDLNSSQNKYKQLENDLNLMDGSGVSVTDPSRIAKQGEFDTEAKKLEGLKESVGLDKYASEAETKAKATKIISEHPNMEDGINLDYDDKIEKEKTGIEAQYKAITGNSKNYNDLASDDSKINETNDTVTQAIKSKETEIQRDREDLIEDKKTAEAINKGVGVVVGATLGTVVGSAFGVPMLGLAGGAIGGYNAKDKLNNAGKKSLNLASNYDSDQINREKENMKDKTVPELREISDNYAESTHKRAAASMKLMEQGEMTKPEAIVKKDEITQKFKGKNNVMNQLDAALMNHHPEISGVMQEYKQTLTPPPGGETSQKKIDRERKNTRAKEKITRGVLSGSIKLENIDDQDFLNMLMPVLANILSFPNLSNMHKTQTSQKQSMMEKSLKVSADGGDFKSARVLVNITSNLDSLEDEGMKTKYMEGIKPDQLMSLFQTTKGISSVVDWLKKDNAGILTEIKNSKGNIGKIMEAMNKVTKNTQLDPSNINSATAMNILRGALRKNGIAV